MMDILCCPTCKGDLILSIENEENEEIISGSLYCKTCDVTYEIKDGIPDLIPKK